MRRLIVNADGFGFTLGINRAILEVLEHGFIRSVSVNVTWPAVEEVRTLARNFPDVSIGIHLNLSVGPPILSPKDIPSLVGDDGQFHRRDFARLARKRLLDPDQMKRELRCQIHKLRDMGVAITHWDSHQGRHLYPGFFEAAMEVALEEGIRATRSHSYHLVLPPRRRRLNAARYYLHRPRQLLSHLGAAWRMRTLRRAGFLIPDHRMVIKAMGPDAVYRRYCWEVLLQDLPPGTSLVECHPAYVDPELASYSDLTATREKERQLLNEPGWLNRAREAGVEVVNMLALTGQAGLAE